MEVTAEGTGFILEMMTVYNSFRQIQIYQFPITAVIKYHKLRDLSPHKCILLYSGCKMSQASRVALVIKNLPADAEELRDVDSIPGSERSPGGGNSNPLQQYCLENPMDRGVWWLESMELQRVRND